MTPRGVIQGQIDSIVGEYRGNVAQPRAAPQQPDALAGSPFGPHFGVPASVIRKHAELGTDSPHRHPDGGIDPASLSEDELVACLRTLGVDSAHCRSKSELVVLLDHAIDVKMRGGRSDALVPLAPYGS